MTKSQRYVEFYDSRACEEAYDQLNGTKWLGGTIDVDWAWDEPPPWPNQEDDGSGSSYSGGGGPPGTWRGASFGPTHWPSRRNLALEHSPLGGSSDPNFARNMVPPPPLAAANPSSSVAGAPSVRLLPAFCLVSFGED
jgi:RNA recognition motif-containing protein